MVRGAGTLSVLLLLSVIAAGLGPAVAVPPPPPGAPASLPAPAGPESPALDPLGVHPGLSKGAAGEVTVTVLTSDVAALAEALEGVPYRGLIGRGAKPGLAAPTLTLPASEVERIAAVPGVLAVAPAEFPEKHRVADPEARRVRGPGLTNYNSTINLGALGAWGNGFRGEGTTVAIVDDGLDVSHPDLLGTVARVADDASPYYPLPMAFDPYSMLTYLSAGDTLGTWYVNTSSTDRNVTHTIKVDGKNDFWTDGTESVADDLLGDVVGTAGEPDYDLISLFVTQDRDFWYFGFNSLANQTNLSLGVYLNTTTTAPWTDGGTTDPAGNFVDTVATQRPEFAVYMTHYGLQSDPALYDRNDTILNATVYRWSGGAWDAGTDLADAAVGGQFAYSGWSFERREGFVEFSLPKAYLGDPPSLSVEAFTVGINASHAQDTVYSDPNVEFPVVDWSPTTTTLSAAVEVGAGFWRRTYVRPDDLVGATRAWSTQYQVPATSKSGVYYFGDLPDENFPLTRILVVDEAAAGAHDTVYVDLDHDKDFTNDKPLKRYGRYDASGVWFDPAGAGCAGCPTYDEFSWGDFVDPASGITAVDWSPDGSTVATASNDHTVILWDPDTGAKRAILNPHVGRITDVRFSPDGSMLAAAVDDASGLGTHVGVLWRTSDWTQVATLSGHAAAVASVAWSPDSSKVLTGSEDATAKVWVAATGALQTTLSGHAGAVNGVDWGALGTLATASEDGTIKLWAQTGVNWATLTYGSPMTSVAANADESIFASASRNGNVVLWDRASQAFLESGTGWHFDNEVLRVRWGPTGDLASSSAASSPVDTTVVTWIVTAWDNFAANRTIAAHVKDGEGWDAPGIAWSPETVSPRLLSGGLDRVAKVWGGPGLLEQRALSGHLDGSTDTTRYRNGDGVPDVSGGMVYFLADGSTPIPYSVTFADRYGVDNRVPAAGQLVALFGAYDGGASHGTLMGSSVAGQGVTQFFDPSTMDEATSIPQVVGIAPGAKLLPVGDIYVTTIFDAWFFVAEGYDGVPGTGDEPQVVANSFGFSSTYQDGWDIHSRFLDYVSAVHGGDAIAFTVSAGNDGNGYGTVTAPASAPNVVTVGASTDFYYRWWAGLEGGPSQSFGDVVPFSSRGPTAQGRPDPDLLATGRMSVGSTPLNFLTPYNGATASELWSGTSLASPMAAGILALVYQAYEWRTGSWPDAATAKSYLLSAADDVNNDVLAQGAGLANADRATRLAAGLDGLAVTPNLWVPGDYQGTAYEAFPAFLSPGDSDGATFTVTNRNTSLPDTASFSTGVYRRTQTYGYGFLTAVDAQNAPQPDWSYFLVTTPIAGLLSGPGIYRSGPSGLELMAAVSPADWLQADLVRVVYYANASAVDPNLDGANDYRYMVDVYDWTWDGMGVPLPDTAGFKDLNRMSINHPDANHMEIRVHNPASRTHTALVTGLRPFGAGAANLYWQVSVELYSRVSWNWVILDKASAVIAPGGTGTVTATVTVPAGTPVGTYEGGIYVSGNDRTASWSFAGIAGEQHFGLPNYNLASVQSVEVDGNPLTAGTDYTVYLRSGGLSLTSPLNPGSVLTVDYTYRDVTTIPVTVTIPAPAMQFPFGGSVPGSDDLYGNHVDMGYGNGGQGGDWHFFFVEVPSQGLYESARGLRFLVDASWEYARTDLNVFAFGPGGSVPTSLGVDFPDARYGPYLLMTNNGGSEETANFFTTTGGAREIVAPKLAGGLNVIALRQVRVNGTVPSEDFAGQVGMMSALPESVSIVTNQLAGETDVQLWSSLPWEGLGAVSAGPSAPESFVDVPIKQDNIEGDDFIELLADGSYTRAVRILPSALIFDVHITSDAATTSRPCPDLDLGVFLDGLGAGNVPNGKAEASEFVAYGADSDADEEVKLIKPTVEDDPDTAENELVTGSPYLIKVLGFDVPWSPTGTFNMDITLVQGSGFGVTGVSSANVTAYTIRSLGLSWNLPGSTEDGRMLGALYVGPGIAPLTLLVPVDLTLDRVVPSEPLMSLAARTGFRTDSSTGLTVNDPQPQVVITARDPQGGLDPSGYSATLDGTEDVTSWVTGLFAVNAGGRYEATLTFTLPFPLEEGGHALEVTVHDVAGNAASSILTFEVDTAAPSLALDQPAAWATASGDVTISGSTDPGARVTVAGEDAPVSPTGGFSRTLSLPDGVHVLEVVAVDWSETDASGNLLPGNSLARSVTVTVDDTAPVIDLRTASPAGPFRGDSAELLAFVADGIAPGLESAPSALTATVNGQPVALGGDGALRVRIPLASEGANPVSILVTDPAGNSDAATVTFLRDTAAPTIDLDAVPERVTGGRVFLNGTVEDGELLSINGRIVSLESDGSFSEEVPLAPGTNDLLLVAEDDAGNVVERTVSVRFERAQGASGFSGLTLALGAAVAAVIGLVVALLLFKRPEAEAPPAAEAPPQDERLVRLEKAFSEGKIDRATYEANLKKLEEQRAREAAAAAQLPPEIPPPEDFPPPPGTVPPAEAAPPAEADERILRLEKAYREGKINREAYEANLAKLRAGGPPAPVPAEPEPPADPRIARLEQAYREGKINREAYEANLAKITAAPATPPPPAPAPVAPPSAPAPSGDPRIARLEQAYREGKISKGAYEANLVKLQTAPAPPPPAAPPPPPTPQAVEDERVARLRKAFEEGKISREVYEQNLRRIRGQG